MLYGKREASNMDKAAEEAVERRLRKAFEKRVPEGWFDWRGLQTNGSFFENNSRPSSPYNSLFVAEAQKEQCVEGILGEKKGDASSEENGAACEEESGVVEEEEDDEDDSDSDSSEESVDGDDKEFRRRVRDNERHRKSRMEAERALQQQNERDKATNVDMGKGVVEGKGASAGR